MSTRWQDAIGVLLVFTLGCVSMACSGVEFKARSAGESCNASSECEASLCYESTCVEPTRDDDSDGLSNEIEAQLGTSAQNPDSDGDGLWDLFEVGEDLMNPADEDGDEIIDAMESNSADSGDKDCLVDQKDGDQ